MSVSILRDLVVTRVDLVDLGENQAADILLYKRRASAAKEEDVSKPKGLDISKLPEDQRGAVEALQKRAAEADAADERLAKLEERATAAEKERDELKKQLEAKPPAPEDIEKARMASLPEDIRKRLEANEAEVSKLRDEKETGEYIAKARNLPLSGTTAEAFGPLLRRIASGKTTAADADEVTRLIKAMGEQIRASDVFGEKGRSGGGTGGADAYEEARALAKTKVESGQFKTVEKALSAVWRERPDLWKRYRQEE